MKTKILACCLAVCSLWAWDRDGSPIATGPGDQTEPRIVVSDAAGCFYVVWADVPGTYRRVVARRFDLRTGNPLWSAPLLVADTGRNQWEHQVVCTPSGSLIVAFTANFTQEGGAYTTHVTKIGADGTWQWPSKWVNASSAEAEGRYPELCLDATGEGCYVAWTDYRTGSPDVWAAHVTASGQVAWEVPVCDSVGERYVADVIPSGGGSVVLFWDHRTPMGLYAQHLVDSVPQWDRHGKLIIANPSPASRTPGAARLASLRSSGTQDCACPDGRGGMYAFAYHGIQRVDSLGSLLWDPMPHQQLMADAPYRLVASSDSGAIGCDIGWSSTGRRRHVMAMKIVPGGALPWGTVDTVWVSGVDDTTYDDYLTDIASDEQGGGVIALAPRTVRGDRDIRILRVDTAGHRVWEHPLCENPADQDTPVITPEGASGGYVVVWEDERNGNADIYATYADSLGNAGVCEPRLPPPSSDGRLVVAGTNPHRGWVEFRGQVSQSGAPENLGICDQTGRMVRYCALQFQSGVSHWVTVWDGRDQAGHQVPPGVYFAVARTGGRIGVQKVVLLR